MNLSIPRESDLLWPILTAIRQLDGSANRHELYLRMVENEGFTEEQQSVMIKSGKQPRLRYRFGFALSRLKTLGAVENPAPAVWALNELGSSVTEQQLLARYGEGRAAQKSTKPCAVERTEIEDEELETGDLTWKDQLLARLLELSPAGFERLSQRLLREAGFVNVEVTGKSGDGGIDGKGTYRLSLVSFHVLFQCKRYRGTVSADKVRDFRGAMTGRANRGLVITTGTFTPAAVKEATRDGAPPIDLVNGDELCDLLHTHGLGIKVTQRIVEDIAIVDGFFDEYR